MVKHICRIDHIPTTLPHNDVITVMEVILSLSSVSDVLCSPCIKLIRINRGKAYPCLTLV